jgi:hypothetical protein
MYFICRRAAMLKSLYERLKEEVFFQEDRLELLLEVGLKKEPETNFANHSNLFYSVFVVRSL